MYTPRILRDDLEEMVQSKGNNLLSAIREGKLLYDKWYSLTYGLTDAQIIALPSLDGITQTELVALQYALGVFNDIASGTTLSPAMRDAYLVPFL